MNLNFCNECFNSASVNFNFSKCVFLQLWRVIVFCIECFSNLVQQECLKKKIHLDLGGIRIHFSKWFNNEFKLGTTHLDPYKSRDLLFSRRGDSNNSRELNYSSRNRWSISIQRILHIWWRTIMRERGKGGKQWVAAWSEEWKLFLGNPYRTMVSSEY